MYGDLNAWQSGEPERGWAMLEFPRTEIIERVVWGRDREGKVAGQTPRDYVIEVSIDGENWKTVAGSWDRETSPPTSSAGGSAADNDHQAADARPQWTRVKELQNRLVALEASPAVYAGRFRRAGQTYVLAVGDPMHPLEQVGPSAVRSVGHPLAADQSTPEQQRRLALADWIIDDENPLTDRVIVNRIWHSHFGQGLSRTPSDFGFNGDQPSHPQLLDWLASEFRANGRRFKPLHRLIALSNTYRQSNLPRSEVLKRDADNRWLWRYAPRRMEAEAIRDAILQVSGNLDVSMGGPGYDLWEHAQKSVVQYQPKENIGPEAFRRMVYQFRPRIYQDPIFGAFDCPDGALPMPRRTSSTTALQALSLLNSPFIVDQSQRFADRLVSLAGTQSKMQIRNAFELALGREPLPLEQNAATQLVDRYGLAVLCRSLFNSSEFVSIP